MGINKADVWRTRCVHQALRLPFLFIILITLTLFLSGCVTLQDPEASQEYRADLVAAANPEQFVGQTFVSRRPRLNGVQVWLRSTQSFTADHTLLAELYHSPSDEAPLAASTFSHDQVAGGFPLTIDLPPQNDPPGQSYYLALKTSGGYIDLLGRNEDAYIHGEALVDGIPRDADIGFRLSYDYGPAAVLTDLWKGILNIWLVIPLALALWAPGRLLVFLLESKTAIGEKDWLDAGGRAALSIGLSLALIPLVMLWTSGIGLKWGRVSVLLVNALLATLLIWKAARRWERRHVKRRLDLYAIDKTSLALLAVILFSLGIRFVMTRDLAAPAWVDPVHHATISRLIHEKGAFPDSYAPYVQTRTASYHPGFHSLVAAFLWLSGLESHTGMLLLGQVLNALCALGVYLFTVTYTKNHPAGVIAALITAAFTPMPAYLASWGRYTQLAGLLVLPVAISLFRRLWDVKFSQARAEWLRLILTAAIACAGLFLIHYRVIAFLALLLLAEMVARTLRSLNKAPLWKTIPSLLAPLAGVAVLAILLTLPWWPTFWSTLIAPRVIAARAHPLNRFWDFSWGYLTTAYGKQIIGLAALGLAWSLIRARWFGLTLALWIALLFVLANPTTLGLPEVGLVNNTSVEIMLFIPISTLGGYIVAVLIEAWGKLIPTRFTIPSQAVLVLAVALLAFAGARKLLPILNPITFLFRQADWAAIQWAEEHLPADGTVLINPFLWGYGLYAGQDGGYWLTPLAGIKTIPPPVLYGLAEGEAIEQINEISRQAIDHREDPQALYDLMRAEGIDTIYLGVRGGAFSAQALQTSPLFKTLFDQDGVRIFQIESPK